MKRHVLICGGGVIGASIAYFLSRRGIKATVIERTGDRLRGVGKVRRVSRARLVRRHAAAGSRPTQLRPARRTRRQSRQRLGLSPPRRPMAVSRPLRHRGTACARLAVGARRGRPEARIGRNDRAGPSGAIHRGDDACRRGSGCGIAHRARHRPRYRCRPCHRGQVDGETLALGNDDAVVIAMGPWSILAAGWLRLPAVFGLKGHSLVFDTGPAIPAEAAFLEYRESSGEVVGTGAVPTPGRDNLCLRDFERERAADRPGRGDTRSRRDRTPACDLRAMFLRCSPRPRCSRHRPASARSLATGCR